MSRQVYSFGVDSPIKFVVSDKLAERYNEAVVEFFKAQQRFNQKFGRQWDPATEPIKIKWNRPQRKAWNDFGKVYSKMIEKNGPFHENDIMDDFLVKNTASVALRTAANWGRWISLAVAGGVLYGLLRRR